MKTVKSLSHLPNTEGFRFIGLDGEGVKHQCQVRRFYDGLNYTHYVQSDTVTFKELAAWVDKS